MTSHFPGFIQALQYKKNYWRLPINKGSFLVKWYGEKFEQESYDMFDLNKTLIKPNIWETAAIQN
jgi:hypothetical protein